MSQPAPGIRIYLPGETPPLREYATRALSVVAILEELAEHLDVDAGEWGVTRASTGSLATVVTGRRSQPVESVFLAGIARLKESPGEMPDDWTREALGHLGRLPSTGPTIRVGPADARRRQFELDHQLLRAARKLSATSEPAIFGSVIGELDEPQRVDGFSAVVVERDTRRRIRITFDGAQIDVVGSLWGRLVEVQGMVRRSSNGRLRSVEAQRVVPVPAPVTFGTIVGLLEGEEFDPRNHLAGLRD